MTRAERRPGVRVGGLTVSVQTGPRPASAVPKVGQGPAVPPSVGALAVEFCRARVAAGDSLPEAVAATVEWLCGYSSDAEVGAAVRYLQADLEDGVW